MLVIERGSHSNGQVPVGQVCRFRLRGSAGPVETRVFLKHEGLFYLEPVADWATRETVELYPEAPGAYVLAVQWRRDDESTGWTEIPFVALAGARSGDAPRLVEVDRETRLWVPTDWEAQLMAHHERATLDLLRRTVKPGLVVYDIGAHLGLYAVVLARLVGPSGHVYCIEANPVCVSFLTANLRLNRIRNVDILPVAASDGWKTCEFTINYENLLVGIGKESPYAGKPGHRIEVRAASLDDLIEDYALRAPDLLKVDIEGAEVVAVAGMQRTIARHRPWLLFELHGQAAARQTLAQLEWTGYRYEEAGGASFPDGGSLSAWFPDACLQVLGRPA